MRRQGIRPDGASISATIRLGPTDQDDTPLVFIPGWLCDAGSWDGTAARLSAWRTCVTLDLPGFGASDAGNRNAWSLASFGADVTALIDALPGRRAILVGHSMGGAIALEAAIAAPDIIERVVAVDSFVYPAFYDPTPEDGIEPIVASFAEDFPLAVAAAMQSYILPVSRDDVRFAVETMARSDPMRGLAVLREFLRWDVDARLAETRTPVSIIAASAFMTPDAAARWSRHNLTCLHDVGHFLMLDNPAAFDRTLLHIIEGVSP